MKEFKGTRGDWYADKPIKVDGNLFIDIRTKTEICNKCGKSNGEYVIARTFRSSNKRSEQMPNAQLIAAAPELLEALQESNELIEWLFDNGEYTGMETAYNGTINQMNDNQEAINKALGL